MAEIAVSFAIDQLLPLLREEASLLQGIHQEFADIKDELRSIQAFLKDADKRTATEEGVKTWVKQVTEVAFRIEDIIDEYMVYVGQQSRDPGCAVALSKIAHLIKTSVPDRHRIASEIQGIKSKIQRIKQGRDDYHLQEESSNSRESQNAKWHDPRMASLSIEEAELVGFEAPREELIGWLLEEKAERNVISVVGMGGQGKTTLAKKVFDSKKVVEHFDCHAWITVSQSYTVKGLLRDMSKFLKVAPHKDILDMDGDALRDKVKDFLQEKRYVIVFDDVWEVGFWRKFDSVVYNNRKGSRVIITTRNIEVADFCRRSSFVYVHQLKPLTQEDSQKLFYKKAFQFDDFNGCCPKELEDISDKIVKKCDGLPLAIVTIGGLLSGKKKTRMEWQRFFDTLSSELERDSDLIGVTRILGFSYDDLPYYLKSCFLYFGIYPEDYEVKPKMLIRQWIAEGFVKKEKGITLEEVAERNLLELIGRSLVQVSSFSIDGRVKRCRVHDLLREMILKKFEDSSFCQHISEDDELVVSSGMVRRLSIGNYANNLLRSVGGPHTRSLLVFTDWDAHVVVDFMQRIPKKYRLLKLLHIENCSVPKNWGNLTHLKYLNLRGSWIKNDSRLWKLIGNLHNLETLDIRGTRHGSIGDIHKLKKLRHLLSYGLKCKNGIGGMTCLQTLRNLLPTVEQTRELGKLCQLRDLGLGVTKAHEKDLCCSINEMKHLEKLYIQSSNEKLDLDAISSPSPMLRKLRLDGKLEKLPKWISGLQNLVKLTLSRSNLTDDPTKSLKNLSSLLCLCINYEAYEGESLHFEGGGFQQLKELHLGYSTKLISISIDRGALQSLKILELREIKNLKLEMLSGIQYLENLELLDLVRMSDEFEQSIAPDGGEEHPSIKHVPRVRIVSSYPYKERVIYH